MLPRSLRIHAHDWKLQQVKKGKLGEDEWGLMLPDSSTIQVYKRAPASRKVELVFHEVLHALILGHGFPEEETIVTVLGEGLTQFLKDNPSFFTHAAEVLSRT